MLRSSRILASRVALVSPARVTGSYRQLSTAPRHLGYTLDTDPRLDKRHIAPFCEIGLGGEPAPPPDFSAATPRDEMVAWSVEVEAGFGAAFQMLTDQNAPLPAVEKSTEVIKGVDGNDITLYISKPKGAQGTLPCVYHTHGGGMAILHATDSAAEYFRDRLATEGVCVVGVDFRNCGGSDGNNVFPAGLNDCTSGLYWVAENKAKLGIDVIVTSGESGGGNLATATTMQAKRDGRLDAVDGCFAMCPCVPLLTPSTFPSHLPALPMMAGTLLAT